MSSNDIQIGGDHYKSKSIQPWDAMEAWLTPEEFRGFLKGNAIKYLARCNDKGGLQDIKKANHYITKLIETTESNKPVKEKMPCLIFQMVKLILKPLL